MLHIVNKSPFDRPTLESVARIAQSGALLLIEDGVIAAAEGVSCPALEAIRARMPVFALGPDLEARGLHQRVKAGIEVVDYAGFVALVAEHRTCQTWL